MKSVLNGLSEVFVQHGNPVQKPDLLQTQVQGRGVPLTVVSPGLVGWSSHVSVVALSEGVPDVLWSSLPAPEHLRCPQLLLCPSQAMHRNIFQGGKGFQWEKMKLDYFFEVTTRESHYGFKVGKKRLS